MDTDLLIIDLARQAGVSAGAVQKWRERGKVPYRHREELRERAERLGRQLGREEFDRFGNQSAGTPA